MSKRKDGARTTSIWLDYGQAGRKTFLPNLSAVAAAGEYLWTASDEMRTIECLASYRGGYRLHRQFKLDKLFPGLPGAQSEQEADIEGLDVADGLLWVSGSHSLTRRSQRKADRVDPKIRKPAFRSAAAGNSAWVHLSSCKTHHVRLRRAEPLEKVRQPLVDVVDVERCDLHGATPLSF